MTIISRVLWELGL